MSRSAPIRIGVTCSHGVEGGTAPGAEIQFVMPTYLDAVFAGRALPLPLAYAPADDLIAAQLDLLDGLLLTGGHDLHPRHWGEDAPHPACELTPARDAYEVRLVRAAWERDIPVLAICRGMQVLAALLGGSLWQDRSLVPAYTNHRRRYAPTEYHEVEVLEGTRLAELVGRTRIVTNSNHHQFVRRLPPGWVESARCLDDGACEAMEPVSRERFVVAVQWHPERMRGEGDPDGAQARIWGGFLDAARRRRHERERLDAAPADSSHERSGAPLPSEPR